VDDDEKMEPTPSISRKPLKPPNPSKETQCREDISHECVHDDHRLQNFLERA